MKRQLLMVLCGLLALGMQAKEIVITSPDGRLVVTVNDEGGRLAYTVDYDGQQMLAPSALGLKTDIGDFTQGLTLKDVKESAIDRTYTMTRTKASSSHYVARQADLTYVNGEGLPLTVTFWPSTATVTPSASLTGSLPIRDIALISLVFVRRPCR